MVGAGLRGQPRHAPALEQRAPERPQPLAALPGQPALRRVPARADVAPRRARALPGLARADDGLRAFAGPGPPALSRSTAATCRGTTRTTASPSTTRCRPRWRSGSREAPSSSSPTPSRRSSRAAPTTSSGTRVTWSGRERRHLALRAGPQPRPGHGRRDPRPLGGSRLRAPGRQGQEVPRQGRAHQRHPRRLAAQHRLPLLDRPSRSSSGRASATCPASSGPAASRRSTARTSSRRTRAASIPARARSSTRTPSSPRTTFNFYYGTGARVTSFRGFGYHNQDLSLIKNTSLGRPDQPAAPHRGLQPLELAHLHRSRATSSTASSPSNTDLASPDFGKWNGSVTNPRDVQVAARFEF